MEIFVFKDLLILFALSIAVLLLGHRLNIPPVVGFIITGVIAGPHGLGFIQDMHDVDTLAQVGILLLLFGIGMEFSIKKLAEIKKFFLVGGALQVGLTTLVGYLVGILLGRSWQESLFLGFILSMSSTAIVLRLFEQKGQISSPQGRAAISILIFQDMIAIPMLLLTPMLGASALVGGESPSPWLLVKGLIVLVLVFLSAQRLIPNLLHQVAKTRCRELFLLSVLTLCFGVAWLTASLGLSLTIGAFLAGLIISESDYSNEAVGDIFPFQALFISFFFVSVGMLLDVSFVINQPLTIIVLAAAIIVMKTFCAGIATLFLGMPIRTAVLVGVALSQVGEFSFVLAKTGISYQLGTDYEYQLFLAVSILTLSVSPVLINFSPQIANLFYRLPLPNRIKTGITPLQQAELLLENHVIIIGFGVSGKNLARSSKVAGIPYVVLEMNPDTVREQKRLGEPIQFGDATHPSVLEHVKIGKAKAVAVLANDPIAAKHIVKNARDANPGIYIIVRTRYVQEMGMMTKLGADEAIPDEFGSSVEIFTRVLQQYHIPHNEIQTLVDDIRADGYEMLRNQNKAPSKLSEIKLNLSNVEVSSFRLHSHSTLVGKSLAASNLRQAFGMTVLVIKREHKVFSNPPPDTLLQADDIVVVIGEKVPMSDVEMLFNPVAVS